MPGPLPTAPVAASSSATTSERYMRAFAASLAACSVQAQAYGQCIAKRLPEIEKNCCQQEFESLKRCFYKEFQAKRKG